MLELNSFYYFACFQAFYAYRDLFRSPVNKRSYRLKIRKEPALGDRGNVRPNTALFLGLAASPNDTALDRALASQFTTPRHSNVPLVSKNVEPIGPLGQSARPICGCAVLSDFFGCKNNLTNHEI